MPEGFEHVYVDCECMHPGCTIRITRDTEVRQIWVEFQTYMDKGLWSRLRDAWKVLVKKQPHNWAELTISEESAKKMAEFLTMPLDKTESP